MKYSLLYVILGAEDETQAILKIKRINGDTFTNVIVQVLNQIERNKECPYAPYIHAYLINENDIEDASEHDVEAFNFEGRRVVVKNRFNLKDLIKHKE